MKVMSMFMQRLLTICSKDTFLLEYVGFYWNVKRLNQHWLTKILSLLLLCAMNVLIRAFSYRSEHFPFRWYKMTRKLYRKSCVSFIYIHIKCYLNSRREWVSKRFISRHQSCETVKLDLIIKRIK